MAIPTADRGRRGRAASGDPVATRPNRFHLSLFSPLLERATRDVVGQLGQPCLLLSGDDTVRYANASLLETLAIEGAIDGRSLYDIGGGVFDTPDFRDRLPDLRRGGRV